MKSKQMMNFMRSVLTLSALLLVSGHFHTVAAQIDAPFSRGPARCTLGTASGVYGVQMTGQLLGVGPLLVNGLFTQRSDGTMDNDVYVALGNQSFPAPSAGGSWKINEDCTGSGQFTLAALNLDFSYNFVVSDGGDQLDLLVTTPGMVLNGTSRRISQAGRAPSCNNGTLLGAYGYRLSGSAPNLPFVAGAGTFNHRLSDNYQGLLSGADTLNLMGQHAPRTLQGTFTVGGNCRGTGAQTDSLGNAINYVFVVVNGGETIYLQSTDPGVAISGVAQRLK